MTDRLHLEPRHRKVLERLLREHLPGVEVWAYGSRVNGRSYDGSDLDLVLRGPGLEKVPVGQLADFEEAVRESTIPFLVEARDWVRLPKRFHREIEREYVIFAEQAQPNLSEPEWSVVTVDEISEKVAMGPFGSSIKVDTFVSDGVPIISGQHLHGSRVDDSPGHNFITPEHAARLANANVEQGDVVFTHSGSIGQVAYIPQSSQFPRYVVSQRQFYMRCNTSKAIPEFVTSYFRSPEGQHKLLANASQVGVPSIARPVSYLRTIELSLPSLSEQRAIAHILGTLDDKIELNRRMNETLETMARALFRSWFVDFDPVRAKMDGRDSGLPQHIADLFPDQLVGSGIGEIPEGWTQQKLSESFSITMGQSPPGSTYNNDGLGIPFFQGRADFRFRYPKRRKYCTEPRRIANSGDTLVSVRAPVGDINIAWERCCIGRGLAALRHKSDSISFTYYSIRALQSSIRMYEHFGTVFGAINRRQFEQLQTLEPNLELVEKFDEFVSPIDRYIKNNALESHTLANARDYLLPKLISGEIRVPEAEKMAEAVV